MIYILKFCQNALNPTILNYEIIICLQRVPFQTLSRLSSNQFFYLLEIFHDAALWDSGA